MARSPASALSYDQAPPLHLPLRFFLTAPLFGILAGGLLLVRGGAVFASRWTGEALAATHCLTAGFMLQIMLGALVQFLPVGAGVVLPGQRWLVPLVHGAVTAGSLALVIAFLGAGQPAFLLAGATLALGVGAFALAGVMALRRRFALVGIVGALHLTFPALLATLVLGLWLVGGLAGWSNPPVFLATALHAGWGLFGWAGGLLLGVSLVVVPMFQLTPAYPGWVGRGLGPLLTLLLLGWSVARLGAGEGSGVQVLPWSLLLAAVAFGFCLVTLGLQRRSRRPWGDPTQRFWRLGLVGLAAAALLWGTGEAGRGVWGVGNGDRLALWIGVLVLFGGFIPVICGMLYKIMPFLIWLDLQNRGRGRVIPPNMKRLLPEAGMMRHLRGHAAALVALLAAPLAPDWLAPLAGVLVLLAFALLAANLLGGLYRYRHECRRIADCLDQG